MNEKQKSNAVQGKKDVLFYIEILAKSLDRLEKAFADCKIPEFLANFQREAGTRLTFVDQISKGRDLQFGPCIEEELLMHDPSSGDESEESGSIFKLPPKLSEVLNVVYDPRVYIPIRRIEEAIPGLKLYLMFSGLDSDTNPKNFYESVLQIANRVNPNVIVDCVKMLEFGQPNQRAIVEFKDDSHCCLVYEFLNSPRYRGRFKNKKQEIIRISYALDSSRMEDSGWVAVVIRNLPKECNKSVIVANCSSGGEKVLYATNPIKVKDMECCIVRVKTIEDAEQICRRLNKRRKDKEGVFVDIHPNSNYKRVNPDASLFNIFKLEHYFPGNLEGKKVRARDEVAEYNKQIIEKHLKESNINTPLVGLNCTDIESLKKTLDNVSESTIRNNKIISLLSEITSQEKVQHIDIVESAPPLRKVPQECDKKGFRRECVPPDERNSNSNLRTKDSSDSEPTFDPNLGKNNVNDLEFCIDDNEKPKIQTDMDVDFVKKRNIKFKAKEEAKDIDEEEETSYKICGEGDKQRESDRHNRNNGFKRELNKNKSRFVEDAGDDIF